METNGADTLDARGISSRKGQAMKKRNANTIIRAEMLANERVFFSMVREANKDGKRYQPSVWLNKSSHNALTRLERKGRIVFIAGTVLGRKGWAPSGYVVVNKAK
jgi:hypothetical protein